MKWTELCKTAGVDPELAFDRLFRTGFYRLHWEQQIGSVMIPLPVNLATVDPRTLEIDDFQFPLQQLLEDLRNC